jgi:hypothetical protein
VGFWLGAPLAAAIVSLVALRQISRTRAFADRRALPLEEIHASLKGDLTFDILNEVWTRLGASYSVDPLLIRPNDPISLSNGVDSWTPWKDMAVWIQSARPGASTLTDQRD